MWGLGYEAIGSLVHESMWNSTNTCRDHTKKLCPKKWPGVSSQPTASPTEKSTVVSPKNLHHRWRLLALGDGEKLNLVCRSISILD